MTRAQLVTNYGASIGAAAVLARPLVTIDHAGEVSFDLHPDPAVMRVRIDRLIAVITTGPDSFTELPLEHQFVDGMYIRRLFIKKGQLIAGHIHKKACINFVETGDISVLTETGMVRVGAGFLLASPAGLQKIGYAHEDTTFTNIFRAAETDIEALERELIWESRAAMLEHSKQVNICL
jgi:hypothetical protein